MATDQSLQTNWGIHPSMSARMRISLVSWIVFTGQAQREEGYSLLEPLSGLHQLTKAFLEEFDLKTVFLLALGSGKRRSEIHAWQNKNIRHQSEVKGVIIPLTQHSFQEPAG